jgi:hypothetical protein
MSTEGSSIKSKPCPVLFCGTPNTSVGFDTFLSNAQKISSIDAQQIVVLGHVPEKTKTLEYGILVLLLGNKNDLVNVLNALLSLKKRIERGVVRIMVYNLIDHDKIAQILKQKGATESVPEGLTQKALVHKLQKHIQIVHTRVKSAPKAITAEETAARNAKTAKNKARSQTVVSGKLKYIAAVENENDCWLVKNKKDFKFVRGMWLGEMIGPGPSAGTWTEVSSGPATAAGEKGRSVFQWSPRVAPTEDNPNPFTPGKGSWYFSGRQPEFVWKTNRWRFVGDAPALFFKPSAGAATVFRFRCPVMGTLEVALNSSVAKGKLKAISQTYAQDKLFREEKKKEGATGDLDLPAEEGAAGGAPDTEFDPEADLKDWGGDLDAAEGEGAAWNDEVSPDEEGEDAPDWNGTDIGRGNKFNSGRGMSQGTGKKGYKYAEDEDLGDPDAEEDLGDEDLGDGGDLDLNPEFNGEPDVESAAKPAEKEWASGADAFDRIRLDIAMSRVDTVGAKPSADISLLERQDNNVLIDAPGAGHAVGETLSFAIALGQKKKSVKLDLVGVIKRVEPADDREILLVEIHEKSRAHLGSIQRVFDLKQEELLRFLREAKGDVG